MSIIRYGNVALSNLRKGRVDFRGLHTPEGKTLTGKLRKHRSGISQGIVHLSSSNQGRVQLVARMRMIDWLYRKHIYVAHSCQRVELDLDSYYS